MYIGKDDYREEKLHARDKGKKRDSLMADNVMKRHYYIVEQYHSDNLQA